MLISDGFISCIPTIIQNDYGGLKAYFINIEEN